MLRVNQLVGFGSGKAAKILSFQESQISAADLTTYSFSGVSFGAAATNRYIVVAVQVGAASARTFSSGTIGGQSASIVSDGSTSAAQTQTFQSSFTIIAAVPTGTSGTVSITLSGGAVRCGIGVWRLTGIPSATANDVQLDTSNPGSVTLSTLSKGVAIGNAGNDNTGTTSWTNLTERYDEDIELGRYQSGADETATSAGTLAITATRSASAEPMLHGISW